MLLLFPLLDGAVEGVDEAERIGGASDVTTSPLDFPSAVSWTRDDDVDARDEEAVSSTAEMSPCLDSTWLTWLEIVLQVVVAANTGAGTEVAGAEVATT